MDNPDGHPASQRRGHKAIARRVAGPLAAQLDFQAPAPPPEGEEEGGLPGLEEIGRGLAAAVFAPQLAIAGKLLSARPALDLAPGARVLAACCRC